MVAGFIKKILFRMNRLNTFVNMYKSAAKEVYLPSLAYINWGIKLLDEGHSKEALKKFEISKDMAYQNPESYLNIGMIKAKNEEFEEAIEYFRKAIRIDNRIAGNYAVSFNYVRSIYFGAGAHPYRTVDNQVLPVMQNYAVVGKTVQYAALQSFFNIGKGFFAKPNR